MIYKRFTFLVILRTVLIIANVLVIAIVLGDTRFAFIQIILAVTLVVQTAELIRFVNHTNRELARLFTAIRHSDFSITFTPSALGKSFSSLAGEMAEIVRAYKDVKIEKEAQFHFLQLLVNQLHVGIIALENKETITLINQSAQALAGVESLKSWKLLQQVNPRLADEIDQLGDNEKKLIEVRSASGQHFISASASTLIMLGKSLRLITLQNINSEIEQKEIEAWHKLIRILTHEIMNSVTPIASLTETLESLLRNKDGSEKHLDELKQETISDIRFSLGTIHKRTDGLLQFVDRYRKLARVPKPALEKVEVSAFMKRIAKLMEHELSLKKIRLELDVAEDLHVSIDPMLIEQILINLLTNSISALEKTRLPVISLKAYPQDKHIIIAVVDNGKGISPRELSEIFVPFYTTKQNGSGIGLSLSKQIMAAHGGTIRVQSEVNAGASFLLRFNRETETGPER